LRSLLGILIAIPYTILCASTAMITSLLPGQKAPTWAMQTWAKLL